MNRRRAVMCAAGAALTVATWRAARRTQVGAREARLFTRVNHAPDGLHLPIWMVMQAGSLAAVWAIAAVAWRSGRERQGVSIATVGTAVWCGVKLVKPWAGRGRPQRHLEHVRVRGRPQTGLGYPSGHAAVSTAVAILATAECGATARATACAVAATVGLARIYVGAHLPLDVAGGFGIGVVAGNVGAALLGGPRLRAG